MKSLGKSVIVSLLLTGALLMYLNMENLKSAKQDLGTLEVAAGAVPLSDPTSKDPLLRCYPVASPDDLDIRTRMDFEARTSGGWVAAPDQAKAGQFCVVETPDAVEKRLTEHGNP